MTHACMTSRTLLAMRWILLFVIGCLAGAAQAQATGCDSPRSHELDFWVGDWDLEWTAQGKTLHGHNRISKILDGCAVLEEFDGAPGNALKGRSMSALDATTGEWRQTWVDNSGAYLEFHGGLAEGRMVLSREFTRGGKKVMQRMVYDEIRPDGLRWQWQRSLDEGKAWTTMWDVRYRRAGTSR